MFGKLVNYEVKGQIISFEYEKMTTRIEVISDEIINVFAGLREDEHRSKAIEGEKVKKVSLVVNDYYKEKGYVEIVTDKVLCRVGDEFFVDFYEKDGTPVCLEYRGKRNSGRLIHPETSEQIEKLLRILAEKGEDYTFAYIKSSMRKGGKNG